MSSAKEIDADDLLERGFLISGALLFLAFVGPGLLFFPPFTISAIMALPAFAIVGLIGTLNDGILSIKSAGFIIIPAIALAVFFPKFENDPTSFVFGFLLILPITWRINRTRIKWALK